MPIPPGSHYTSSNRHSVQLSDGSIVSRTTAENIYAQEKGYRSNYERRSAYGQMKSDRESYERGKEQAQERTGISGRDYDEARAALANDYRRAGNDYRQIDKSPNGPLANYLVAIGRRSDTDAHMVGDSPSIR